MRPARKGGIRLEAGVHLTEMGNKAPVVYNYGSVRRLSFAFVELPSNALLSTVTEATVISHLGDQQASLLVYSRNPCKRSESLDELARASVHSESAVHFTYMY